VNIAGILRDRMIFNMSDEEWVAVIAVHLKGHFTVTKHAAMVFRQQRSGRIVNTSSESGLGNMGQGNYSAAKEGIVGLTRTLALDLGRYGVTANAIRPRAGTRLTLTPELRAAMERARAATKATGGTPPAGGDAISQMDELKPELVAPLVVFLCTDKAANINGRDFIAGGNEISLMSLPEKARTIYREGGWTLDALDRVFAATLGAGVKNPMPAQEAKA
jgi:NAD(P)-dependent dehydrogenase (short-subunit alcohol dehydrogenase family)